MNQCVWSETKKRKSKATALNDPARAFLQLKLDTRPALIWWASAFERYSQ